MQKAHRSQFVFRLLDCQQTNILLMRGLDHTTSLRNDKDAVKISSQEFKIGWLDFKKERQEKNSCRPEAIK